MKQNPGFFLTQIKNTPYLLPYGQTIAEHCSGVQINQTGVDIWNILVNDIPFSELIQILCERYQIPSSERDLFQTDINEYIQKLLSLGILLETSETINNEAYESFVIGGISLRIFGETKLISQEFDAFRGEQKDSPIQNITLHCNNAPVDFKKKILLTHPQLCVFETLEEYHLTFPESEGFTLMTISKDGKTVHCYCKQIDEATIFDVFCGIRISFLYICMQYERMALHSASILYDGKAWLFSGSSGTGKSTQTNLWKKLCDVSVLNGDVNLIARKENGYEVLGIPWCGTSGIFTTESVPLGGIVLLKQDKANQLYPLTSDQATLMAMQRLISPTWTKEQVNQCLAFTASLQEHHPVLRYGCTLSEDAVWTLKSYLDEKKDH